MGRYLITGLGVISSIGHTVDEFWNNLTSGVSGIDYVSSFDATGFPIRIAGEVRDFDPTKYMDRKLARRVARPIQFSIATALQALEDAGIDMSKEDPERVGIVYNTGGGGITEAEKATIQLLNKGPRSLGPFVISNVMPNAVSCRISILIGAKGPIITSTAACASGNYSFFEAWNLFRLDEADVIIVGGTEASISPVGLASLIRMGALSSRNDEPKRASRPFDRDRDGFVLGEGAAAMVIETEEHARKRGAKKVYAELLSGALTGDAYHITAPDPQSEQPARAMRMAIQRAGLKPEDIDLISAHGTSTPLNDVSETKAIKKALGEHAYKVAITGTKSMLGHTLGAAGALGALAAVMSIHTGVIPPTINLENPDPECDLDYVPNEARKQDVRIAMVNAFGFGGQNSVSIFKKYE